MTTFCSNCGTPGEGTFCADCGHPRDAALVREPAKQYHGVPAIASFFIPGLGQLLKGEILKGMVAFGSVALSVVMIAFVVGIVTTPIIWLLQLYDAYTAQV